jgi:L-threonylcarbamoyladenylate synthase
VQEAASKLYAAMHELDHKNLDIIIAEKFPAFGLGNSINDRLQRATFK